MKKGGGIKSRPWGSQIGFVRFWPFVWGCVWVRSLGVRFNAADMRVRVYMVEIREMDRGCQFINVEKFNYNST